MPRNIEIKFVKIKDKEKKILKSGREKHTYSLGEKQFE